MDTSQIRRGNIVLHNNRKVIVENIREKSINIQFDPVTHTVIKFIPADEIKPFPLGTDILIRMGFKWSYQRYIHPKMGGRNIYIKRKVESFFICFEQEHKEFIELKSVHHLQNIYRDWFNIELTF